MSSSLLRIVSDFDTQLVSNVSIGGTTATLVSATDDDGNALPSGTYGFTVDAGNSSKEYIICSLSGTSLTSIQSITRQGVTSSGFARSHRRGAKVTLTDWAILSRMLNNLDGTTGFNSSVKLGYDADPGLTSGDTNKFATVKYVNDTAIAGSPDATTTTKGIGKVSVAPVSATSPIFVGDNDPRVPTVAQVGYIPTSGQKDALVGNNTDVAVGTGNKYVTQTGLQHGAEIYGASTTGNDTYVVTLSPAPTSYTTGMKIIFKPDTANTGACTLNVNGLGAKTIKKNVSSDLNDNDILANQTVEVIYDGTNFQYQPPVSLSFTENSSEYVTDWLTSPLLPDADLGWTIAGTPSFVANGWAIEGNTNGNASINVIGSSADTSTLVFGTGTWRIRIKGSMIPVNATATTTTTSYCFFGFSTSNSAFANGDITNVTDRVGVAFYNAKLYLVTANGTSVTATEIATRGSYVWDMIIVDFDNTTARVWLNGTAYTQATNVPNSGGVLVQFGGYNSAGSAAGLRLVSPTISTKFNA